MPEMDGIAVTQELKKRQPDLQVIVMTVAPAPAETAVEAIRHGAFDYVSKPMNLEEIKSTVRRIDRTAHDGVTRSTADLRSSIRASS